MDINRIAKIKLNPDFNIDKTQLLQEARQYFKGTSIKPSKLVDILTKCIFILLQGDKLAQQEAQDLFFGITQLFQHKSSTLRRLTHIGIKALSKQVENVYIATSSLITDVNSSRDNPAIRASALRALCQITEAPDFISIERYLKQSVVDQHPVVASAAISSLVRIATINSDIVKRCTNEIQEALNSESPMVQYHALALTYNLCKDDRVALSTLINNCIKQDLHSPLATCLLIRIISNYNNEYEGPEIPQYLDYIHGNLNNKTDMVEYEAANAIVNLKTSSDSSTDKRSAIAHLRNFLTSRKPALRFASVRSLNELAATSTTDIRFWSVHRIGNVCKLHLLNRRYKPGDHIVGVLDFANCKTICAKYSVILHCEETQSYELKQEFCLGLKKNDFMITIPQNLVNETSRSPSPPSTSISDKTSSTILHCVLSFLFYIADKNYPKTLFSDKAGTIELGPTEIDTKLFSCDFPIAIHT